MRLVPHHMWLAAYVFRFILLPPFRSELTAHSVYFGAPESLHVLLKRI